MLRRFVLGADRRYGKKVRDVPSSRLKTLAATAIATASEMSARLAEAVIPTTWSTSDPVRGHDRTQGSERFADMRLCALAGAHVVRRGKRPEGWTGDAVHGVPRSSVG
ncbi:hypothetical protein L0Y81_03830 [Burkholderia multivorans]|uniref:hypothetical protein n=1 Tax=Burkholderia multivorans TaxID=87883 RepID=UPI0011B1FA25|nr:hypothetical protein [Burkholderia multivorans]MBR8450396.1 hypothetical protein [Burkholderia multivorans]MBU9446172.1 hypothetical protein [Burkholderia multivorans]MCL4642913.1 hypothetical protein [Burkholderia multivorans]UQN86486.1 hypothetical protein L0Y85_03760 [Burkholderia multivorans]UQO71688.1 hypothetical protein L0Y81_03830 [Burkholderia multivorans]